MPITQYLKNNAQNQPNKTALVEINPDVKEFFTKHEKERRTADPKDGLLSAADRSEKQEIQARTRVR